MVFASVEIGKNLRELAARAANCDPIARRFTALAELFDRLQVAAEGDRPMRDSNLRTLGRVYTDIAVKIAECIELVDFLTTQTAREHITLKLGRIGELTAHALLLADVTLPS